MLAHAEMVALAALPPDKERALDNVLYTTLSPCPMCFGAIVVARVGHVHIGALYPAWQGIERLPELAHEVQRRWPQIHGPAQRPCWRVVVDRVVLRRHVAGAGREQWAVVPDGDQVAVMRAATGTWAPAGAFPTVEDAIAGTTALREVHRETASFYDLAPGLNEHEFVALLDPCDAEGSDDPDEWPDEELDACEWEELDIWSRADEFTFHRRVARVGDWDLAWIDDDGVHVPVLADEDGFRALAEIASTKVATYLLVTSMIAGDGGNDLVLIAPGVACNVPTGEEAEYGETGYFLVGYPDDGTPDQQAAAIAGWLDDIKFTFWAAMLLEPLDPGSTIPAEDREAWDEFDSFKRAVYLEVPDGIEPLLPSELTEISGMYKRIAEARRNPAGEVGRELIASNYSELFFSGLW